MRTITITIDQLLRIIESIVFTGPLRLGELKAHLKLTVGHTPEPDVLQSVLTALADKYSSYLYGIEFSHRGDLLEFKGRGVQEILNY